MWSSGERQKTVRQKTEDKIALVNRLSISIQHQAVLAPVFCLLSLSAAVFCLSVIRRGLVFDDEAGLELRDGGGEAGGFDTAENFGEVLVSIGRFVDRVFSTIC